MKLVALILTYIFFINAFAAAPLGVSGQSQSNLYPAVVKVPNNQSTNTGAATSLLETGNKNILSNPSFEHSTVTTGWTNSAGTPTADLVNEIDGLKALSISLSSQTLALTQDSTLYASQFNGVVQGLATVRVKTSILGVRLCARQAGVTSSTLCVTHSGSGNWELLKVPFILSATSNGLSINTASNVTGTVLIDDAFVGAVDLRVDGFQISQTSTIDQTATFNNANITGALTTSTGSGMYTYNSGTGVYTVSSKGNFYLEFAGQTSTTAAVLPAIYVNGVIKGLCHSPAATSQWCTAAWNQALNPGDTFYFGNAIAVNMTAQKISVVAESAPTSTYTSTNADTDWQSCSFSTLAWQGLGTVGATTKCKRQGSDLVVRGDFSTGTVAAAQAQIPLPLWNGQQLTIASSSKNMNGIAAGRLTRLNSTANNLKDYVLLAPSSASYLTISAPEYALTFNALSGQNGNGIFNTGDYSMYEYRVPIEGWENSNIIIGSFAENKAVVVQAYNTTNVNFPTSATYADFTFNTEIIDTHGAFDGTTFTAPIDGYYHVVAQLGVYKPGTFIATETWDLVASPANGTSSSTSRQPFSTGANIIQTGTVSKVFYLTKNQTVKIKIGGPGYTGTAPVVFGSADWANLSIMRVGAGTP